MINSTKTLALMAALCLWALPASADDSAQQLDDIRGPWMTHEGGEIEFHPCSDNADKLCGTITALRPEDAPLNPKDVNNPDESLRDRPLLGLTMFEGLEADSDGKWSGGTLYDSKGGRTVKSKIRLNKDGTLKISGCVSFFCRSFDWTRVSPTMEGAAGE